MNESLVISGLRKAYPGFLLNDVSFRLPRGYIMGLIGPNGAGKTTVIKLILNLVRREAGHITVLGRDNLRDETWVRSRVGFVHETPAFHGYLTVRQTASLVSRFYPTWDDGGFRKLAGEFGLPLHKRVSRLSHGTVMKLSLTLARSHRAEFLLFDEPTSGLDPVFRRELLERLSALIQDGQTSILFSTHITSDLERLADYLTFLRGGEVVFSSSREEIQDNWLMVKGGKELLEKKYEPLFRAVRTTTYGIQALTSRAEEARRALAGSQVLLERPTLDEIVFFLSKEQ
ncbi:MAG TPA: ABC transporter ATP-binding protein [Acidobacteriota bacterium]